MKKKVKSREWRAESKKPRRESGEPEKNSPLSTRNSSLIFGVLPVLEALRAEKRRIDKIFVLEGARENRLNEIFRLARENNVLLQKTSRENLARMADGGANHQGVVAFVASADYTESNELLAEITAKENSLTVILDGVEDPRNFGAILRVVEGAGADGVFIPERRAVGLTETVAKSSAGAAEYVKVAKVGNLNRLLEELKSNNIWVVGTSGEAEMDYTEWDWTRSSALVLGSEGKGLHRLTAEKCDALVRIPMRGKIESLNVSVAAGVILFEAIRQRTKD